METTTILTILGVAATVILGAWGVFLAIRQRRYPGQILFVREGFISLFADVVKDLPELSVLYKDKAIEPNVVLIRGTLLNSGNKDIAPSMIEKPLQASLPEGGKCLTAKVVATSPNVQADIAIEDDRSLVFNMETMLRREEHIRFTALAELPSEHKLSADPVLKFSHRIADTRPVRSRQSPPGKDFPADSLGFVIVLGLAAVGFLVAGVMSPSERLTPQLHYSLKTEPDKTIEVEIDMEEDGRLTVRGVNEPSYSETTTLTDFVSKHQCQLVMGQKLSHPRKDKLTFGSSMLVLALLCLLAGHMWRRRNMKLRRILGLE